MINSLLKECKILKVEDSSDAGVTVLTTDIVDMQGFSAVCFIIKLGAVVDAGTILATLYQDTAAAMGTEAAVDNTVGIATTSTDSEQVLVLDVIKPKERYLRLKVARTTQNSTVDSIIAILYNPARIPVTQPATVDASTLSVSPAES
jgi:hypothetical protein